MEAHIEALMRQNAELLLRNMEQPHLKVNQGGHEEENRNSNTNARREDDHQGDRSLKDNYLTQRNRRPDPNGGRQEDAGDLSRVIVETKKEASWISPCREQEGSLSDNG